MPQREFNELHPKPCIKNLQVTRTGANVAVTALFFGIPSDKDFEIRAFNGTDDITAKVKIAYLSGKNGSGTYGRCNGNGAFSAIVKCENTSTALSTIQIKRASNYGPVFGVTVESAQYALR